jgi:hypothetical protein
MTRIAHPPGGDPSIGVGEVVHVDLPIQAAA